LTGSFGHGKTMIFNQVFSQRDFHPLPYAGLSRRFHNVPHYAGYAAYPNFLNIGPFFGKQPSCRLVNSPLLHLKSFPSSPHRRHLQHHEIVIYLTHKTKLTYTHTPKRNFLSGDSQTVTITGIVSILFECSERAKCIINSVKPDGVRAAIPDRVYLAHCITFIS
jgi:hypothetical protein